MRISAHRIFLGVMQGAGPWSDKYVRLQFPDHDPIFMDVDEALRFHKRLGAHLNLHTTPERRRKAVRP